MNEKKMLKKLCNKLTQEDKNFISAMNNYAISLCLNKEQKSINELCEIIRFQNERRTKK